MCHSDDALYRSTVLPGVLKADQHSHDEKCVNWNEAAIRELLTIRAEAEIIRQFSEMVSGALYTSHERSRVFTGSLRVVCERTHRFRKITGSVNEPKSDHPSSPRVQSGRWGGAAHKGGATRVAPPTPNFIGL